MRREVCPTHTEVLRNSYDILRNIYGSVGYHLAAFTLGLGFAAVKAPFSIGGPRSHVQPIEARAPALPTIRSTVGVQPSTLSRSRAMNSLLPLHFLGEPPIPIAIDAATAARYTQTMECKKSSNVAVLQLHLPRLREARGLLRVPAIPSGDEAAPRLLLPQRRGAHLRSQLRTLCRPWSVRARCDALTHRASANRPHVSRLHASRFSFTPHLPSPGLTGAHFSPHCAPWQTPLGTSSASPPGGNPTAAEWAWSWMAARHGYR